MQEILLGTKDQSGKGRFSIDDIKKSHILNNSKFKVKTNNYDSFRFLTFPGDTFGIAFTSKNGGKGNTLFLKVTDSILKIRENLLKYLVNNGFKSTNNSISTSNNQYLEENSFDLEPEDFDDNNLKKIQFKNKKETYTLKGEFLDDWGYECNIEELGDFRLQETLIVKDGNLIEIELKLKKDLEKLKNSPVLDINLIGGIYEDSKEESYDGSNGKNLNYTYKHIAYIDRNKTAIFFKEKYKNLKLINTNVNYVDVLTYSEEKDDIVSNIFDNGINEVSLGVISFKI